MTCTHLREPKIMFLHLLKRSWAASTQVLRVPFLHEALKYLMCWPWHFYSVFTFQYVKSICAFQVEQNTEAPSPAR